jgi:hypothetical protein
MRDGAMVYDELCSIDDVPILKKYPGMPLSGVCACELYAIATQDIVTFWS